MIGGRPFGRRASKIFLGNFLLLIWVSGHVVGPLVLGNCYFWARASPVWPCYTGVGVGSGQTRIQAAFSIGALGEKGQTARSYFVFSLLPSPHYGARLHLLSREGSRAFFPRRLASMIRMFTDELTCFISDEPNFFWRLVCCATWLVRSAASSAAFVSSKINRLMRACELFQRCLFSPPPPTGMISDRRYYRRRPVLCARQGLFLALLYCFRCKEAVLQGVEPRCSYELSRTILVLISSFVSVELKFDSFETYSYRPKSGECDVVKR